MKLVVQHPDRDAARLRVSSERRLELEQWISEELEDALSARHEQERIWTNNLRMYEGVPNNPVRNTPVENAPNHEITLGAISSDAIYAQSVDALFAANPPVTARATNATYVNNAKAVQRFVDFIVANEINMRPAAEEAILDDVQLGTMIYYIPWVDRLKKTRVHKIKQSSPYIFPIAPEDFLVRGGAGSDVQITPWCGFRTWLTEGEFAANALASKWEQTDQATPVGTVGWVRSQREALGRTSSSRRIGFLYEIWNLYCSYDIDGDGYEEDLLVTWDRSSRKALKVRYNPFDQRPFEVARYQIRPHLFYGVGVLDMVRPFQEELNEIHNYTLLNMLIANCRMWVGREGVVSEQMAIWPNRVITVSDPDRDLKALQMGDVYPSAFQGQAFATSLAERRVGLNELALPRASQVLGSRTPGITALSLIQQSNRRFTPAFDGMRTATSGAVRQCLYRYQERLLAGDTEIEKRIVELLGANEGKLVLEVLKDEGLDEAMRIELTNASASVNKEADRQAAVQLAGVMANYYQRTLELVSIASNPQTPPPVQEVARKIAERGGEIIERTLRTFDQVRDPETLILRIDDELDSIEGMDQSGMTQLMGILQGLDQSRTGGGGGSAPPALPGAA